MLYLTVNTHQLHYKDQPVNAGYDSSLCHTKHINTLRAQSVAFFSVEVCGTYTYHLAF